MVECGRVHWRAGGLACGLMESKEEGTTGFVFVQNRGRAGKGKMVIRNVFATESERDAC